MQHSASKVDQAVDHIRDLIAAQSFQNDRLPSEPMLAELTGTSRATIRQALSVLELDGLIVRKHGAGTFVNRRVQNIGSRLEEVWKYSEMIELAGYKPGVQHIEMALRSAGEYASGLGLKPADEVISTANTFLANDAPVIYCIDVIPAHLVRQAYREEELHGPVYEFLAKRCEQQVVYNITEVFPVVADEKLSALLSCDVGTPLHYFEETGFNAADEPIIYSEEYYRPAYFNFTVVRKMTTRSRP